MAITRRDVAELVSTLEAAVPEVEDRITPHAASQHAIVNFITRIDVPAHVSVALTALRTHRQNMDRLF